MGVPNLGIPLLGSRPNKEYNVLGSILGSLILGKCHIQDTVSLTASYTATCQLGEGCCFVGMANMIPSEP